MCSVTWLRNSSFWSSFFTFFSYLKKDVELQSATSLMSREWLGVNLLSHLVSSKTSEWVCLRSTIQHYFSFFCILCSFFCILLCFSKFGRMPRYDKEKRARIDAARKMREKKEKQEELHCCDKSPPPRTLSAHRPASSHTSPPPLPSTSQQSPPPPQLIAESHQATKMDLEIQLFHLSFPLPYEDDEKYIISRSQLETLASKICSKCLGEQKFEAENNNFDCTITITCLQCGEVSAITPRRTMDDAGRETVHRSQLQARLWGSN